jgi:hypothetical protein
MTPDIPNGSVPPSALQTLLDNAFSQGPAVEANQLIHDVRQEFQSEFGRAANYEVSLLTRSWQETRRIEAARFGRFLHDMGFNTRPYKPVFVSLFHGETVYFIRAVDFLDAIAADPAEVVLALPGSTLEPTSEDS